MKTHLDIGYDPSSLSWTFEGEGKLPRTVDITNEYTLIGESAIRLLNAAKRKSASGATNAHRVSSIRLLAKAVDKYARASTSAQEWAAALQQFLLTDKGTSEHAKWSDFNHALGLLKEVARCDNAPFFPKNPFSRRAHAPHDIATEDEHVQITRQIRADIYKYVSRFRSPPPEHVPYIAEARTLWLSCGFFSVDDSIQTRSLFRQWKRATNLTPRDLWSYLYPTAEALAPFLLYFVQTLAANPDSIALMRRDAAKPYLHPANGKMQILQLEKPRAGSIRPYPIRDTTTLSLGWTYRALLDITQALVDFAEPNHKNFAFLAASDKRLVRPLLGRLRNEGIRSYQNSRNLKDITLQAIRPSRAVNDYRKNRDIFRTQRLLNHASASMSINYLNRHLTADTDAEIISEVQATMLLTPKQDEAPANASDAVRLTDGHSCLDPNDGSRPHDELGFCQSYLWPFNDRHFILDFSPRPIAFVLRDYAALCEAHLRIPTGRFERFYAPRKHKIESDVLPYISPDLRAAASSFAEPAQR